MAHEINLLQESQAPVAPGLSLTVVALAPLVTAALFLGAATLMGLKERGLEQHVAQLEVSARTRASANSAQGSDLAALEQALAARSTTLDILRGAGIGDRSGFAEGLRALARGTTDGVWLTGISLDHEAVVLHGRALSPERITVYLAGLQSEPQFAGHAFSAIDLKALKEPPKDASGGSLAAAGAGGLEFTLASQASAMASGGASAPRSAQ
jgi:Tfp pilus assembly protein PilN